jgi:hypothetical protein
MENAFSDGICYGAETGPSETLNERQRSPLNQSNRLSRRSALLVLAGTPVLARAWEPAGSAAIRPRHSGWTAEWDRALIEAALSRGDSAFDPAESMLRRRVGSAYNYHSSLRNVDAHPTRDSFEYALMLLESGDDRRREIAFQILARLAGLQNVDPASRWYGLWGYYLEEPPEQMTPADWNWADFNGCSLLLMLHRHAERLPERLKAMMLGSLRHAAESIRRRNVSMSYTNIAAMGTFVTFSAAEMLEDKPLLQYACDRVRRFAEAVDESGSFGEYNSPTYASVTLAQLTCFRMFVKDAGAKAVMEGVHKRLWLHLASHWHPPTRQFAGPMSRCYSTVLSDPIWLQKSLDNALVFAGLGDLKNARRGGEGRIGVLDWTCPPDLRERFLNLHQPTQHREVFLLGLSPWEAEGPRPWSVQGTTYLSPRFCLGSVNRGDFWVQRRPLLAYWGKPKSPSYLQLRMIKDDYDFASGALYTTQNKNWILAAAGFRDDGGDKHLTLDPVKDGSFSVQRLYLQLLISGFKESEILLDGQPAKPYVECLSCETFSRLTLQADDAVVAFVPRIVRFGGEKPALSIRPGQSSDGRTLSLEIDLFRRDSPEIVRWSEIESAFIAFGLAVEVPGRMSAIDRAVSAAHWEVVEGPERSSLEWVTPAGRLGLTACRRITHASTQNLLFEERLDGQGVPLHRLSEKRLAPLVSPCALSERSLLHRSINDA